MQRIDLDAGRVSERLRASGGEHFVHSQLAESRKWLSRDTGKAVIHAVAAASTADAYHRLVRGFPSLSLRAEASAWLAEAHRRDGDLAGAEAALHRAEEILEAGGCTIDVEALLNKMRAKVLNDRGIYEEALLFFQLAEEVYLDLGLDHEAGNTRIMRANVLRRIGKPRDAIRAIRQAAHLLDYENDRRSRFVVFQCLALSYAEFGAPLAADRLLESASEACPADAPGDRIRITWAKSRVRFQIGDATGALELARTARDEFIALGSKAEACALSFEVAALLTEQGDAVEARRFATESLVLASTLGLSKFQIAAMRLLARAQRAETRARAAALLAASLRARALPR